MTEIAKFLKDEWSALSGAPLTFVVGWLIFTGVAYVFIRKLLLDSKDATIETLRERVSWTEEQRDSYKSKLTEFENSIEAIQDNSPKELKEKALELVKEIRSFLENVRRESDRLMMQDRMEISSSLTEEERQKKWNKFTNQLTSQSTETTLEFDRKFKIPAIVMRDKLLEKLPEYSVSGTKSVNYEHPTNPIGMGMIADDIEKMARQLE